MDSKNTTAFLLLLTICLGFTSCDDSNPTSALPALTEENFDITIDLAETGSLGANIIIRNYTEYDWEKTVINLTIIETISGRKYSKTLDLGAVKIDGSKGVLFTSTQQVQEELCYHYQLMITPENEDGQMSYQDGTCSE